MTEDKGQYQFGEVRVFRTSTLPVVLGFEGYGPIDHERFARLFREVWQSMSRSDHTWILKHWRNCPNEHKQWLPARGIVFTQLVYSNFYRGNSKRAVAQTGWKGNRVVFWTPYLDALPDDHAKVIIAHELAHVLHFAKGYDYSDDDDGFWIENDADEQAQWWGHDVDAWIQYNTDHEVPEIPAPDEETEVNI
jgi:hypothetical protein